MNQVASTDYYIKNFDKEGPQLDYERFLAKFAYFPCSLDEFIAKYLSDGSFNEDEATKTFQSENSTATNRAIAEKLSDLEFSFYRDFTTTTSILVANATSFLNEHHEQISIWSVADLIKLVRMIEPAANFEHVLAKSKELFIEKMSASGSIELPHLAASKHPELVAEIKSALINHPNITKAFSLSEILVKLAGSDSWNPADIKFMAHFNEEDYYFWLIKEHQIEVTHLIREFLGRFGGTENERTVVEKIRAALHRLSTRSVLDEKRVSMVLGNRKSAT